MKNSYLRELKVKEKPGKVCCIGGCKRKVKFEYIGIVKAKHGYYCSDHFPIEL